MPGARTISLAVLGCGSAGRRHAAAWAKRGVDVRWAVDLDESRARELARSLGNGQARAQVSANYREALADDGLDVVDICLPHNLHAPVGVRAAQAGKHILCEKPLAASLEGADRMIEAAERAGVVLMVAENVRYDPLYLKMQDLMCEGAIGQPALLQATRQCYLRRSFLEERRWFLDAEKAAGGVMMSGGIHDYEAMRMLIGEIESIFSLRARQRFLEMEGDDTSVALIQFRNGAVGTLVESFLMKSLTTAAGSEVHTVRVDGDLGSLEWSGGRTICLYSERPDLQPSKELAHHEICVPAQDTTALLVDHFVHCICTGEEPVTSGQSQRRALEAVLAAYHSMECGRPVHLEQ
jgi:predicted dehydrogenase